MLAAAGFVLAAGCTPAHYRTQADREVYGILQRKATDVAVVSGPAAAVPPRTLEPPLESRNSFPAPPDCPPMPPDDPLAHRDMHCPADQPGYKHWHKQGDTDWIASPFWEGFLQLDDDGNLPLSADEAVELGLIHSREYQFELESLYLSALTLTFERFEFDVQWFGGNVTDYFHFGKGPNEVNTLTTSSFFGFSKAFAAGGQLLVEFANSFVWEFTGKDTSTSASNIAVNFVQPLLRGAFRDIRLETLTQAERNVLYSVRDFARFRKQFYFDIVSGNSGYLGLLLQLQAIRNLEQNLFALEQNLRAHEALAEAGIVSPLQVDQVFQSYQAGRLRLIRANNALDNSLDRYKIQLGLPPELPVELNDEQLEPFELTSPEVEPLDERLNGLLSDFRQRDEVPSLEQLAAEYAELVDALTALAELAEVTEAEFARWQEKTLEPLPGLEGAAEREAAARDLMRQRVLDLRADIDKLQEDVRDASEQLEGPIRTVDAEQFERLARQGVNQIADLFVVQTQIRAFLIELPELELQETRAVASALENRLDLKNQQAAVVDAWRKIRVAADALEADLDVFLNADIAALPTTGNPVDFSAQASSYRVGVEFDAPLNRLAERNNYRAELIDYQRARRDFVALRDIIVQAVRRDVRTLEAERLNFEISRQSLVAAARQVELARLQLLAPDQEGDSSTTQDALNALNSLLDAKNSLIASWVAYETARLQLLLDTEALQLDERGQIRDDIGSFDISEQTATAKPGAEFDEPGRTVPNADDNVAEPIELQEPVGF